MTLIGTKKERENTEGRKYVIFNTFNDTVFLLF